jgi:hypothetical protein
MLCHVSLLQIIIIYYIFLYSMSSICMETSFHLTFKCIPNLCHHGICHVFPVHYTSHYNMLSNFEHECIKSVHIQDTTRAVLK